MADTSIVDRNGKGSALSATNYDNNISSVCGVVEEETGATHTINHEDQNKTIQYNNASGVAVTLTAAATVQGNIDTDHFKVTLKNIGAGDVTVTSAAGNIDDQSTLVLKQYQSATIQANQAGTAWNVIAADGPTNTVQNWQKGADVVSASALPVKPDGNYFDVTGANAITSIDSLGVGTVIKLHFDAALTLTHHATDLILPGAANITTAAGDEAEFVEYASGDWRCTKYQVATAEPFTGLLDEDDMSSDSATQPPSQQSAKAYIDARNLSYLGTLDTSTGTTDELTTIPAGTTAILLLFNETGVNTDADIRINIGDSSGYAASSEGTHGFNDNYGTWNANTGAEVRTGAPTRTISGEMWLRKLDGSHKWIVSLSAGGLSGVYTGGGYVDNSVEIDRINVSLSTGTFNSGEIQVFTSL